MKIIKTALLLCYIWPAWAQAQNEVETSILLAEEYLSEGLHKQSLAIAFSILDEEDTNIDAYILAVKSLLLMGDINAAYTVLKRGVSKASSKDKQQLSTLLQDIRQLQKTVDLQAIEIQGYELLDISEYLAAAEKFETLFILKSDNFEYAQLAIDAYMMAEKHILASKIVNSVNVSIVPEAEIESFLALKNALLLVNKQQAGLVQKPPLKSKVHKSSTGKTVKTKQPSDTNHLGMVLVNIPSGRAQLGPTSKEDEFDQSVERQINSDVEGFLISQTEVTQSQWNQLMDENPSVTLGDNLPVHRVTIEKAKEFARRLSRKEGRRYFLPNETQWEVACKSKQNNVFAGTDSRKSLAEFANYKTSGVKNMLHAVGTKKANPNTLFDMSGNVYEWVLTHKNYESPQDMSVIKGGSWNASFNASRCAHRAFVAISDFEIDIGFRVVTSID